MKEFKFIKKQLKKIAKVLKMKKEEPVTLGDFLEEIIEEIGLSGGVNIPIVEPPPFDESVYHIIPHLPYNVPALATFSDSQFHPNPEIEIETDYPYPDVLIDLLNPHDPPQIGLGLPNKKLRWENWDNEELTETKPIIKPERQIIPSCSVCRYYANSPFLKCAVNPTFVKLTPFARNDCKDFSENK